MTQRLKFRFATVSIPTDGHSFVTLFPDGKYVMAGSVPTRAQVVSAAEAGYAEPNAAWHLLRDEQILLTLVAEVFFTQASPTQRHIAGGNPAPLSVREFEASLVHAYQRHANTGEVLEPLNHFPAELQKLNSRWVEVLVQLNG